MRKWTSAPLDAIEPQTRHPSSRDGPDHFPDWWIVRADAHSPYRVLMSDFDPVSAWAALLRTHAAVLPKIERELLPTGLPLTWYDVLLVVNAAPGRRLRMTELGQQAVVSRERVSRVVTELEQAGLVTRQPNPDDKRSSLAAITPAGRKRLRASAPIYLSAIETHFLSRLSSDEAKMLASVLGRIVAAEETDASSSETPAT